MVKANNDIEEDEGDEDTDTPNTPDIPKAVEVSSRDE
jgi:hypothetical protein